MPTEPGTSSSSGPNPFVREPDAAWPSPGGGGAGWTYEYVYNPVTGKYELRKKYSAGGGGGGGAPIGGGGGGAAPGTGGAAGGGAAGGGAAGGAAGGIGGILGNLGWQDWLKLGLGAYGLFNTPGSGSAGGSAPVGAIPGMNPIMGQVGYGNLMDVLLSKGRTSPDLLNREVTGIQRGTQAQQGALQGGLAQRGMSRSGVGQALGSAIGMAGQERVADRMAQETAMAEERKRQDLDLFLRLFVNPSLDTTALATGQYNANRQYDTQKDAARWAAIAQIIGAFT